MRITPPRNVNPLVAAPVALLLAAGLVAGPANAAANPTITLNAPTGDTLAGHSFTVYQLGSYQNASDTDGNNKINGVNVTGTAQTNAWITSAGITADTSKGLDAAGTLANTTDASRLRQTAGALAAADNKPTPVLSAQTTDKGTLQLNVKNEGLYLVVDSAGLPIIVGTQINGMDLENQALGVATIKSTALSITKNGQGDTTIGQSVTYTVQFKIPEKNTNPTGLTYTDTPTGLVIDHNSLKVKIDNGQSTAIPADQVTWNQDGGFTLDGKSLLADATYGKTVTLTYQAQVTGKDPGNTGSLKATLDGQDKTTDTGTVTLANFDFDLKKTKADGTTAIKGAGFVIKNKTGKYLKLDKTSGKWGLIDAADANAAKTAGAELVTDANGVINVDGLGDGEYTITETTVPDGYLPTPAEATVTIANGKATVKGTGLYAGLTTDATINENGQVSVKNLDSITQLPATGGTGIIVLGSMAAVLATGAGVAYRLRRRSTMNAEQAA